MARSMLVDASHPEETRVVVVNNNALEAFDYESESKKQLKGNIYLAKVTRVEPSLQAAFIEYGGNRHGFLAFNEIHPDYYQIPVSDRERLIAESTELEGKRRRRKWRRGRYRRWRRQRRGRSPPFRFLSELQNPRSYQATTNFVGAGCQGRARQQGCGDDHLCIARRTILRVDAQYSARRRYQPENCFRNRSQAIEENSRRT